MAECSDSFQTLRMEQRWCLEVIDTQLTDSDLANIDSLLTAFIAIACIEFKYLFITVNQRHLLARRCVEDFGAQIFFQ